MRVEIEFNYPIECPYRINFNGEYICKIRDEDKYITCNDRSVFPKQCHLKAFPKSQEVKK